MAQITLEAVRGELSRRSFRNYCKYIGGFEPARCHEPLIKLLQKVIDGELTRLMIFMPPGHAKSTYASHLFPAAYMGAHPDRRVLSLSHGDELATRNGRKVKGYITTPEHSAGFVDCALVGDSTAAYRFDTSGGGGFFAASITSGAITGWRAHLVVIDDPIKGSEQADSKLQRDKVYTSYVDDVRTRMLQPNSIVLMQTRWHEEDLAGRILGRAWDGKTGWYTADNGEDWYILCLPALAEDDDVLGRVRGEPLWPEMHPLEGLLTQRATTTTRSWNALYQQVPTSETGDFFKREWLRNYDVLPEGLNYYGTSDCAVTDGSGDYTVHQIWGVDRLNDYYLVDQWRAQTTPDVWVEKLLDLVAQYKPMRWVDEGGVIKRAIEPLILRRARERNISFYRDSLPSIADKPTRARAMQGLMSMGRVYLPMRKPWYAELEREVLSFPSGANDDQVDAMGLFGRVLERLSTPQAPAKPQKMKDIKEKTLNELLEENGLTDDYTG